MDVNEMLHYTLLQLWSPFYPPYGDADGGWNEGPAYWGWIARVCAHTYTLVQRATGIAVHQRSNMRNQPFYKLYGNPPWFKMSPFGDGQAGPARGGDSMLMLSALYDNPWAKWYGQELDARLSGLPSLLFPTEDLPAAAPLDLPQGRCFRDVGLACSHTNLVDGDTDVAFLMRSCPFGGCGHAYADQNTFVLDAFGEPLIIASGYYQLYGSKHHTQWTWQTRASNSILVNGRGQIRNWDAKGRIAEFATLAAADYIVGDAHRAYPDVLKRYDRRAVFLRPMHTGGDALIVVHDDIEAAGPSTFQFLLHALDQMEINQVRRTVMIRHGKAACRVDFLAPDTLDFHQDNRFTESPVRPAPNQWHLRAETTEERTTALSALTLQPCRRGSETRLLQTKLERCAGALAVTLTGGNRRVVVLYRTNFVAEIVEACGLRTDGQAATVTFVDDRVHSAAVFGGTFIETNGEPLVRSEFRGDISSTAVSDGQLLEAAVERPGRIEVAVGFPPGRSIEEETGAELPAEFGEMVTVVTTQPTQLVRLETQRQSAPVARAVGLDVTGVQTAPFKVSRYARVGCTEYTAQFPGEPGIWRVAFEVAAARGGPYPVTLQAGTASVHCEIAGTWTRTVEIPACSLDCGDRVMLRCDRGADAALDIVSAGAERVYEVNLLPNSSFEDTSDDGPLGCRAGSITKNARCRIESVPGGSSGRRCIKVVCTEATGGDFGVNLTWPGVKPVAYDRRFRLSCQVRADARSMAGIQVTSSNWRFTQTTDRLTSVSQWTETAREFTLPAGENLTHARLHMSAQRIGAELFADDVRLVELAPAAQPAEPP